MVHAKGLIVFGWILISLIVGIAAFVLYASDQPGHRRRRQDPRYDGPDRRHGTPEKDFFERPMFTRTRCPYCDTLITEHDRKCQGMDSGELDQQEET